MSLGDGLWFSRFLLSFITVGDFILETDNGGTEVARQVLKNRDKFIIKRELGCFRVKFLEGNMDRAIFVFCIFVTTNYPE